ncbi:conserved hypothetical protein [Theileria equi strain WA]|uniref:Coiled-coil domain-containing protein 86 n=1 Tax=Theileria equi strain WA TaxID=1537102 RepID=L1LCN3_THEEQ|nr:conserved hypothetical protein [Theileria equi strain WA]EKX73101.1 conserved hypothetical protein [Theileria equi strain WA]|eukprot:XP_004832553.1 conserved hypothetical protein [Theileria equi strain WA]
MGNPEDSLSIKGTPLSGRVWKKNSKPVRLLTAKSKQSADDKVRAKWEKAKRLKEEMKEISKDSRELIEKNKEIRKKRIEQIKLKKQKRFENEIKSAGNNAVVVKSAKVMKMTKKAKKKLTKVTPEVISSILRGRRR